MLIIDSATTRAKLPFELLIPAIKDMFVKGCVVPTRHAHTIATGKSAAGNVLIMPAWQEQKYLGIKTVNVFPSNVLQRLPGLHSVYILFDATTGAPLAMIDGNEITSRRTAAASALAASYLAREDANTLLVVGAGRVGSLLADAYRTVRPIKRVMVWDMNRHLSEVLVDQLTRAGINAEVVKDLKVAVKFADIVTCATLSTEPLILGSWLCAGMHLDLIGSFTPEMRETDDECFNVADVFVDTYEALSKSGDLLGPISTGSFEANAVRGTLEDLCRGMHGKKAHGRDITLFKSVGTALEDLAAATLVFDALAQ